MKAREFKLDGFKWLEEESADDGDELPEPEEPAADAMAELKVVVADLEQVLKLLGPNLTTATEGGDTDDIPISCEALPAVNRCRTWHREQAIR